MIDCWQCRKPGKPPALTGCSWQMFLGWSSNAQSRSSCCTCLSHRTLCNLLPVIWSLPVNWSLLSQLVPSQSTDPSQPVQSASQSTGLSPVQSVHQPVQYVPSYLLTYLLREAITCQLARDGFPYLFSLLDM